jgi:hypothetical protein
LTGYRSVEIRHTPIFRAEAVANFRIEAEDQGNQAMASNMPDDFGLEVAGRSAQSIRLTGRLTWDDIKDDFTLRYEGRRIGRIRLARDAASSDLPWEWHITIPMQMPEWTRGSAGSRGDCIKALSLALGRFLVETSPERLQRAWDFERAAEARRNQSSARTLAAGSAVQLEATRPNRITAASREDALAAIDLALSQTIAQGSS